MTTYVSREEKPPCIMAVFFMTNDESSNDKQGVA